MKDTRPKGIPCVQSHLYQVLEQVKLNYSIRIYPGKGIVTGRDHKAGNHLGTNNVLFHNLGGSYTGFHFLMIHLVIHLAFCTFLYVLYFIIK